MTVDGTESQRADVAKGKEVEVRRRRRRAAEKATEMDESEVDTRKLSPNGGEEEGRERSDDQ